MKVRLIFHTNLPQRFLSWKTIGKLYKTHLAWYAQGYYKRKGCFKYSPRDNILSNDLFRRFLVRNTCLFRIVQMSSPPLILAHFFYLLRWGHVVGILALWPKILFGLHFEALLLVWLFFEVLLLNFRAHSKRHWGPLRFVCLLDYIWSVC